MEGLPMDFYAGAITTVAVLVSRTFCWDFRRAFGGRAQVTGYPKDIIVVYCGPQGTKAITQETA